jgi:hypothetical protein
LETGVECRVPHVLFASSRLLSHSHCRLHHCSRRKQTSAVAATAQKLGSRVGAALQSRSTSSLRAYKVRPALAPLPSRWAPIINSFTVNHYTASEAVEKCVVFLRRTIECLQSHSGVGRGTNHQAGGGRQAGARVSIQVSEWQRPDSATGHEWKAVMPARVPNKKRRAVSDVQCVGRPPFTVERQHKSRRQNRRYKLCQRKK